MQITERILTHSGCYKAGRTITPRGVMVYPTGVAQPEPEVFLEAWNKPGAGTCAHALVHRGGVVETLPWNWRGWHAGLPAGGGASADDTHIAFGILEPAGHAYRDGVMSGYDADKNAAYFSAAYRNAVELCAYLCRRYGLDPLKDILDCHEGSLRGIAGSRAGVAHWFSMHGKSMDALRADVKALLEGGAPAVTQEQFEALLADHLQAVGQRAPASWALQAWEKAAAAGLFDGSRPQAPLSRQQAAFILDRLGLLGKGG